MIKTYRLIMLYVLGIFRLFKHCKQQQEKYAFFFAVWFLCRNFKLHLLIYRNNVETTDLQKTFLFQTDIYFNKKYVLIFKRIKIYVIKMVFCFNNCTSNQISISPPFLKKLFFNRTQIKVFSKKRNIYTK